MKIHRWLAAFTVAALTGPAIAQVDFPNKPIRLMVPFTAGSGADAQARMYAQIMQDELKQPVVVENKPGASGVLALDLLKAAPADGYTMSMGGAFQVVNPVTMKTVGYKPDDFRPVAGAMQGPIGFVVGGNSPHRTLQDLVKSAKAQNRPINIASYTGTYRLAAAWFSQLANVPVADVSYKGAAPVMTDLMGGHLEAAMVDFGSTRPLIREGKIRALAVSSAARLPDFPDLPTVAESYPGYELYVWTDVVVRSDTPEPVFNKLNAALRKAMESSMATEYARKNGFERRMGTADEMFRFQQAEHERYRGIAKRAAIQAE